MKKLLFIFILMTGIVFTSCTTSGPQLTELQKAAIEKQILEQWKQIGSCVEKADAAGYAACFSTNGFLAMYSEGKPFLSRGEYCDSVKVWFSARKSTELQQPTVRVTVLNETLVLLDQKTVFKLNLKDDRIVRCNHAISFIFKKEDSVWKIIHGHESWNNI